MALAFLSTHKFLTFIVYLIYLQKLKESISNITKSVDKTSFSSISYKPNQHKLTKEIYISSVKYFIRCFYLKFLFELGNGIDKPMEKSFLNFIYWILLKSAESYYGDSLKTEVPYTPYF